MRILALLPLLLSTAVALAAPLPDVPAVLRRNEITRVNPATKEITVGVDPADVKIYRCTPETEIRLDDQPAAFGDLAPGMMVIVTATSPGVAARLAAVKPAVSRSASIKPVVQRRVTVPATATAHNPVQIGGLHAGELISIVASPQVRWSAGGAKAGVFCDWNGYRDDRIHGLPRMSLVAIVGRSIFVPSGDTFSFTVVADGGFVLFVNDDTPDDNKGAAEVTINIGWK